LNLDRQKGIDVLFNPKAIAVIGASSTKGKLGNDVVRNLIDSGFEGRIYPINPKGGEILDLKAYRSVSEVAGAIDVAVIVIPAILSLLPRDSKRLGMKVKKPRMR
jgi:acyl-CoA synthetase (NDP forming)